MEFLTSHLQFNADKIKETFHYPTNHALKVRHVFMPFLDKEGIIFFVEGAADTKIIEQDIVKPLMGETVGTVYDDVPTFLIEHVLIASGAKKIKKMSEIVDGLINGHTIILIEDEHEAISVETKGFENRSVSEPSTEVVVKGPKESFIESAAVNRSLIRKAMKDPNLMCEMVTVGERAPQQVSIMYLKGIADEEIVGNVKQRLNEIDRDVVLDLTILEHLIDNRAYSLIPSTMTTERPDRVCAFLEEGQIVLLMDGSPLAIVVPITFWTLFHTAEDHYIRWVSGNFIRLIRLLALFVTTLTPALYIAVTNYHYEMLPTDLMLAISAARERIPFPAIWELLLMEITFEILREAGIRIPKAIGPTIGIVGAIILGQAAVQANIVSPILVIVVAITGLASFTIPDVGFNIAIRILRFIFILAANFMGLVGISLCFVAIWSYMTSIKSFGVPFFAPLAPSMPSSKDLYVRPPVNKMWLRPFHLHPKDKVRAEKPKGDASK